MTTEIYPQLRPEQIQKEEEKVRKAEQRWLISTLIKPELDSVLETLGRCLELVTSSEDVKLPLTSSRTEQAKGILTRSSSEIVDLDMNLHLNTFSKRLRLKLKQAAHLEMSQLATLIRLISETMSDVLVLKEFEADDPEAFVKQLNKILSNLTRCNATLNKPPEALLFPQHTIDIRRIFEPDEKKLEHYKDRISMDFYLLNGEVTVEIKSLHIVTEEPWCHIDPTTGKSHVDKLRDDLKHHRTKLTDILQPEETYKRGLTHVLGINKYTPHDYFTRGVTYNGHVVIEMEKTIIHCQDPNILSISAKLNGLEHLVSKMYSNLDLSMM